MPAVSFIQTGKRPTPVASGSIAINVPATTANDIIVIPVLSRDDVASTIKGYEQQRTEKIEKLLRLIIFWQRSAGAAETNVTVEHAEGDAIFGRSFQFRNAVQTGNPWEDAAIKTYPSTTPQVMGNEVEVASEGTAGLAVFGIADDGINTELNNFGVTEEGGLEWTEREDFETTAGSDLMIGAYTALKTLPSKQKIQASAFPSASAVAMSWMGFLKPATVEANKGSATLTGIGR